MKTKGPLKIVKNNPHPDVLELAKVLMKMAEDGRIKNMVILAEMFEEDPYLLHAGDRDAARTLGLMDWAKSKWREDHFYGYPTDPEDPDPSG